MTDNERLEKLEQAVRLLRDVEFSYKEGQYERRMIYRVMVDSFSLNFIGALMTELKKRKWAGQGGFPKTVRCVMKTKEDLTIGMTYIAKSQDGTVAPECYVIERNDSDEPDFYYDIECFEDVV